VAFLFISSAELGKQIEAARAAKWRAWLAAQILIQEVAVRTTLLSLSPLAILNC